MSKINEIEKPKPIIYSYNIYAIRSPKTDKYYVGCTVQTLGKRMYQHRKMVKTKNEQFEPSIQITKLEGSYIELIQYYKCRNKDHVQRKLGKYP